MPQPAALPCSDGSPLHSCVHRRNGVTSGLGTFGRYHARWLALRVPTTSRFCVIQVPRRSIEPLVALKTEAERRGAEWFVVPANLRQAADDALATHEAILDGLGNHVLWQDEGPSANGTSLVDRMRSSALLCARASKPEAAAQLLRLCVESAPEPPLDVTTREDLMEARRLCADGSAEKWRLQAAASLVDSRVVDPWPPTLVQLVHGCAEEEVGAALCELVRRFATREVASERQKLAVGAKVLAEVDTGLWARGQITRVHTALCRVSRDELLAAEEMAGSHGGNGRGGNELLNEVFASAGIRRADVVMPDYDCGGGDFLLTSDRTVYEVSVVGGRTFKLSADSVCLVDKGGAGAMLRAAAAVACPRLVELLADAGVSTHVTDEDARTPLHWAALAGDTHSLARLLFGTTSHADYLTRDPLPCVAREARSRNQEIITNLSVSQSQRAKAQRMTCALASTAA